MIKQVLFIFIAIAWMPDIYAQQINTAKLDSLFDVLDGHHKTMGTLAVSKKGKVVYTRSVGYSAISSEGNVPASSGTDYRIASISKMFTAVMIFQLIEEDKLGLSTTLDTFFPQIPNAKIITIRQMLTHRSGLQNFINDTSDRLPPMTEDQLLDKVAHAKPDFVPGSKADYSNTNFILLGYIIERIEHRSYSDAIRERIIKRIGLNSTYYGDQQKWDDIHSYRYGDGQWIKSKEPDMSLLAGAGAVISTPSDLTTFIDALFSGKLVSKESLDKMTTITDGYGMGMIPMPYYYYTGYGHTGGLLSSFSAVTYFPEDSVSVAYCSNGTQIPINQVLVYVLGIVFSRKVSLPSYASIPLKTEGLDIYLGEYYNELVDLRISISKDNTTMIARATDQSAFSLYAIGNDTFVSDRTGIELIFHPKQHKMFLLQNGHTFTFIKQP